MHSFRAAPMSAVLFLALTAVALAAKPSRTPDPPVLNRKAAGAFSGHPGVWMPPRGLPGHQTPVRLAALTPPNSPDLAVLVLLPMPAPNPLRPAGARGSRIIGGDRLARLISGHGVEARVAWKAAWRFAGLLRDLEASGYRAHTLDGYARRMIDPRYTGGRRIWSKHARGLALDINQEGRDVMVPKLQRSVASSLARRWGLCSGGDWRDGDLGHFEVC